MAEKMNLEEIKKIVCEVCCISIRQLTARTKVRDVVMARHILGYILYNYFNYKLRDIAQAIGTGITAPYRFLFDNPIRNRRLKSDLFNDRLYIVERIIKEKIKKG